MPFKNLRKSFAFDKYVQEQKGKIQEHYKFLNNGKSNITVKSQDDPPREALQHGPKHLKR